MADLNVTNLGFTAPIAQTAIPELNKENQNVQINTEVVNNAAPAVAIKNDSNLLNTKNIYQDLDFNNLDFNKLESLNLTAKAMNQDGKVTAEEQKVFDMLKQLYNGGKPAAAPAPVPQQPVGGAVPPKPQAGAWEVGDKAINGRTF
jgi:hypothetical protein